MLTSAEKIRKARESVITLGPVLLTIMRPTHRQALDLSYNSTGEAIEGIAQFVIDWKGVQEMDLYPGGTSEPEPFDSETFSEWLQDKPEHWEPLIAGVRDAYSSYCKKTEEAKKN